MGKPETPTKIQTKIVEFVNKHHSYGEAARKFKVCKSTAMHVCERHGISSDFKAPQIKRGFFARLFG